MEKLKFVSHPSNDKSVSTYLEVPVILQGLNEGIAVQDRNGAILYINDAGARLLHYENAAEALTRSGREFHDRFEILDENGTPTALAVLPGRRILAGEKDPLETVIGCRERATGKVIWSLFTARAARDEHGEIQFITTIFRDITACRQNDLRQKLLAEVGMQVLESNSYTELLEALGKVAVPSFADCCGIHLFGEDGVLRLASVAYKESIGEEIIRRSLSKLDADKQTEFGPYLVARTKKPHWVHEVSQEHLETISRMGEQVELTIQLYTPRSYISVPLISRGRFHGVLSFIMTESAYRFTEEDLAFSVQLASRAALALENAELINNLKTAEKKYRELTDQILTLNLALEHAVEGIARFSPQGKFVSLNSTYSAMMGYEVDELEGQPAEITVHPDDREAMNEAHRRMLKEGKSEMLARAVRRDGSTLDTRIVLVRSFDQSGRFSGHYRFTKDITESRRLHSQLIQSEKMSALGTLAAGVAHEINNPLTYVLQNLLYISDELGRLAQEGVLQQLRADELIHLAQASAAGAEQMRDIVKDLKIFSRDPHEDLSPIDLISALETAVSMAFHEMRHRAQVSKDFKFTPKVRANESRLIQVFLNILVNAAQAIQEGAASQNLIHISTRRDENGNAVIEITDSGCGMPPEVMAQVFDPFFTTKKVGEGTGLGLTICHAIVSSFGGTIQVASELGRGSKLKVTLPTVSDQPLVEPAPSTTGSLDPGRKLRILIVEDEELLAQAIARGLKDQNEVLIANSGLQALSILKANSDLDIILCDLMMPEMTGMDVYREALEISFPLLDKFVFMTGGAFTERARAFLDGVKNPRLEKPFSIQALKTVLQDPSKFRSAA